MTLPRKLHTSQLSRNYNKEAIERVDKVMVNGEHFPMCVAYDMDEGWAVFKNPETRAWLPKKFGVITVTERSSTQRVNDAS